MTGVSTLSTTIETGSELAGKIAEVAGKSIPEPPRELTQEYRWIEITIKNETQFDVRLLDTYFESGRYWTIPGGLDSFAQETFSVCNTDHGVAGVEGGSAFRLSLDDTHHFDFSLGWIAPTVGSFKTGVDASSKGKDGYYAATDAGGTLESSDIFQGRDKAGDPAKFKLHISADPGQSLLCVIKQVPVV